MQHLTSIQVAGFRSIREMDPLSLGPINVFIGANGSGKSNLVAFFDLLHALSLCRLGSDELGDWVARNGGASSLLYYGTDVTSRVSARMNSPEQGGITYEITLTPAGSDRFKVQESVEVIGEDTGPDAWVAPPDTILLASDSPWSRLPAPLRDALRSSHVFHLNNTSDSARVKRLWRVADGLALKRDGGNLAPFLMWLRAHSRAYYDRIVSVIRIVAPFFGDFVLEAADPDGEYVLLQWRERGSDHALGPHQLSDGLLRFMVLTTLLLQPAETLPGLTIIDEPELGLHPAAVTTFGNLVYTASDATQVILTTQSPALVDAFGPEDVVVVSREREWPLSTGRYQSRFLRLDPDDLGEWMEDYALSELWDKGVLGGRPQA